MWGSKNFIFKGKFRCGKCDTLIIGQEKYKKQKDGSFKRHVYYTCTGRTKRDCKQPYIREVDMSIILNDFINNNHKKVKISDELSQLISQHREASNILITHYDIDQQLDDPVVEYARYVLNKGSELKKRQLVDGITNNLLLKNGVLKIDRGAA